MFILMFPNFPPPQKYIFLGTFLNTFLLNCLVHYTVLRAKITIKNYRRKYPGFLKIDYLIRGNFAALKYSYGVFPQHGGCTQIFTWTMRFEVISLSLHSE